MKVKYRYDDYWKLECEKCGDIVGIWKWDINEYNNVCFKCNKITRIEYDKNMIGVRVLK